VGTDIELHEVFDAEPKREQDKFFCSGVVDEEESPGTPFGPEQHIAKAKVAVKDSFRVHFTNGSAEIAYQVSIAGQLFGGCNFLCLASNINSSFCVLDSECDREAFGMEKAGAGLSDSDSHGDIKAILRKHCFRFIRTFRQTSEDKGFERGEARFAKTPLYVNIPVDAFEGNVEFANLAELGRPYSFEQVSFSQGFFACQKGLPQVAAEKALPEVQSKVILLNFYKIGVQGLILIIATARVMFSKKWNIAESGERNKILRSSEKLEGRSESGGSVFTIRPCGVDHSDEVCVGGVTAALVAG
jgi:hypothetical protein